MKYKTFLFITFIFNSIITPQESIRMEFGNGTSSVSDFSIEVQDGDESFQIDIKRLRSNLRGLDFQFEDGYNNEYVKMLLNIASASGDGITIRGKDNEYLPTIEIGKLSYSLNDWDVNVSEDGPIGSPTLSAKISLQQFKLVPPRQFTRNLSQNEWDILKVFYQDGALSVKKVSVDFTLNEDRIFNFNAQIDLPVGKAVVKSKVSIPSDFRGEPYIETTEIDLTSLTPGLREVIDELLANSNEIPLKKKGTGYQLRFSGELNNPRFY